MTIPLPHRLAGALFALVVLIGPGPTFAASLEVFVHDSGDRPMKYETVQLHVITVEADRKTRWELRRQRLWAATDVKGNVTFSNLPVGQYRVEIRRPRRPDFVAPANNPLAPPPQVTLLDPNETLRIDVELTRGVLVTTTLDLPDDGTVGFQAVFRHGESDRVLTSGFPKDANHVERLLLPGVWQVEVVPRPGYLLVGVERDRTSIPGHVVGLDLLHEPESTFLTWTYTTPCALRGVVVEETGLKPTVSIVAELLEAGSWLEAAQKRGGSIYEEVTAYVDPENGWYEMVLPDGSWRIRPVGEHLAASEPEAVDLVLAPGDSRQVDFTVRLEGSGARTFSVSVEDSDGQPFRGAFVEIYPVEGASSPVRTGVTGRYGDTSMPELEKGSYLVVAGHKTALEGRLGLVDYDPGASDRKPQHTVVLSRGATLRLRAEDGGGAPLANVALTVERLGDPPDLMLQAEGFVTAKVRATATTDRSGRLSLPGFYPGTYRARARLGGDQGNRSLIVLASPGERPEQELELGIRADETIELEARLLPATGLRATLACSDAWLLPGAAAVRVFPSRLPGEDPTEAESVLELAKVALTGKGRDTLAIGPLTAGSYAVAVRPVGFDRWSWAFETHDPTLATGIQVTVEEGSSLGTLDLGFFALECGPAVDLLPAVVTGQGFPDVLEVEVAARILDSEDDREIAKGPDVQKQDQRILLRALPRGGSRLELSLTHAHLLPEPTLQWLIPLELGRGSFREIVPEMDALGGAIRVVNGTTGRVVLHGALPLPRQATLDDGSAELPSLPPGRYRLELYDGKREEGTAGEPQRVWPELEVLAGETLTIMLRPSGSPKS